MEDLSGDFNEKITQIITFSATELARFTYFFCTNDKVDAFKSMLFIILGPDAYFPNVII